MNKVVHFAVATLAMAGAVMPASATTWYSASNPLTAYKGTVKAAQGYGNFFNHEGSDARNISSQKDPYANGNPVYVENRFYFHKYSTDCQAGGGTCWVFSTEKETDRTSSSSYSETYRSRGLQEAGDGARDVIRVYEDKPYATDPSSSQVIVSFNY